MVALSTRFDDLEDLEERVRGWLDLNAQETGHHFDRKHFAIEARDSAGDRQVTDGDDIIGGISGSTNQGWMFVALLAVRPDRKGEGIGGTLLKAVEDLAKELGCVGIWLDSYSFEGTTYYPRHGYSAFGELTCPDGVQHLFFKKDLT